MSELTLRNHEIANGLLNRSGIDIITIGSELHLEFEKTGNCTSIYSLRLKENLSLINTEIDLRSQKQSKLNFLNGKINTLEAQLSSIDRVAMGISGTAIYFSKLLLEEVIAVLQVIRLDLTNEEIEAINSKVDDKKERQNEYNKPAFDVATLILLAEGLKENQVFLKDIKKGEISDGWASLTGFSFDTFRNMQTPGKREEVFSPKSIRQMEKLIAGLSKYVESIKK